MPKGCILSTVACENARANTFEGSYGVKIGKRDILIAVLFVLACGVFFIFEIDAVRLSPDDKANILYKGALSRALACIPLIIIAVMLDSKKMFYGHNKPLWLNLAWCLPALAVVVVNFPFYALISGSARLDRFDLMLPLALECLAIGLMEEFIFRGLFQPLFFDVFKNKKYSSLIAVAVCSALFGLWHLANLFSGAAIGPTLLQVVYSFLIGAMLSAVFLKVGNIFPCVVLHALFDFGGYIVPTLGSGLFQDGVFWGLTIGVGVLCGVHVLLYLLKRDRKSEAIEIEEKIKQ